MTEDRDAAARRDALDITRSFIVQAPAGSGKTELLIQRYLSLLQTVEEPEQVVAITFTRKAAAEMRGRVIAILDEARHARGRLEPHRLPTLDLARTVLERDHKADWKLLARPGRIRIETVDALNGSLADRLPLLAGGVTAGDIVADARGHYLRAAERALERALTEPALRIYARLMLRAAGDSLQGLTEALAEVLPFRDQWLGILTEADADSLQARLERCLTSIAARELGRLTRLIGTRLGTELDAVLVHSAAHADGDDSVAPGAGFTSILAGPLAERIEAARTGANLLLTNDGRWRRRFTRQHGFPPPQKEAKAHATALVAQLADIPGVAESLLALRNLPGPVPAAEQLERALAARELLRHALAELKVLFAENQAVDFLELALAAQHALGAIDAPSDLLLALDRRIEHVLVDEFQDTSHSQFRLLELLTAGWSEGDGRTMFLVGDPMQSIYRFRDADMSLFLRALSDGVGNIRPERLVLTDNYRSSPTIVEWVNQTFRAAFPATDDPDRGAPAYSAFLPTRAPVPGDGVRLHRVSDADMLAQHDVVARILADQIAQHPEESVAVLVQSRSHLAGLRTLLADRDIAVRAIELDTLSEQPVVQLLIALTRAMLHPGDRIAWLALLRGPWSALSWTQLHQLCSDAPESTVRELLQDEQRLARISDAGARRRLRFVRKRLGHAYELRGRYTLPRWIECCWQLLDGPAILRCASELAVCRAYFERLAEISRAGDLLDPARLEETFDKPVDARTDSDAKTTVEIMTIHRAKGLEFDTVVLFGIDRRVQTAARKAIYWRTTAEGTLFAAMSSAPDPLTRFLQASERDLDDNERARLLYVAATRAKRRLHLVGHLSAGAVRSPHGSLLTWLQDQFFAAPVTGARGRAETDAATEWIVPPLQALAPAAIVPMPPLATPPRTAATTRTPYEWATPTAAHIGTVVHTALHRAGSGSPAEIGMRLGLDAPADDRYARQLRLLGVGPDEVQSATERVLETLRSVLTDARGQWLLAAHESAQSELEISTIRDGHLEHLRLDRTFIDANGVRWIVDYKTGIHSGGDVETFLDSEVARYRSQLESYAAAMYQIERRQIRVGLYFPLLGAFRDWEPGNGQDGLE